VATNIATADMIISSPLLAGDYVATRPNITRPSTRSATVRLRAVGEQVVCPAGVVMTAGVRIESAFTTALVVSASPWKTITANAGNGHPTGVSSPPAIEDVCADRLVGSPLWNSANRGWRFGGAELAA